MKMKTALFGVLIVAIAGAGIIAATLWRQPSQLTQTAESPLVDQKTLESLPAKDASAADVTHLDASITPPTNSWLSGMVLQKLPQPVFPMPLSFLAKDTGFEIGLPAVASTPTVISGGHTPGLTVNPEGMHTFKLTRYDKVSATLTYKDAQNNPSGALTLAEGSPFVFYEATIDSRLTISDIGSVAKVSDDGRYLRYSKGGHDYVALASEGSVISTDNAIATLNLKKGGFVTFYALPDAGADTLRQYAGNKLTGVDVQYKVDTKSAETSLIYKTANNKTTLFTSPSYRSAEDRTATIKTYDNIYGVMNTIAGTTFTMKVPLVQSSNQLNVAHVTDDHKRLLIESLKKDITSLEIVANDSYYAGKQLARMANLLDIAHQLKQDTIAEKISASLKTELVKRLDGKYFYYDSKLHGIAAQTPAFGSEDFNDHHFHYGYFIYAASVLGRYDASFVSDHKTKVNLLVADIASYENGDDFPVRRNYDPYTGHSWAAGLAPFVDGNNQESSSEAMNAWNAVAEWGRLIDNQTLTDASMWMLANESMAAQKLWRSTPAKTPANNQFSSPLTSLNFGGKRTYSTFFTDEPNPKLAIQLIPMNPSMTSFAADGDMISRQLTAAIKEDNYNVPLGDYSLMYLGLRDPKKALSLAANQENEFIDDGNSRTYLEAWMYVQNDRMQ